MPINRRKFLMRGAALTAGAVAGPHMRMLPNTNVSYAAGPGDAIVVFVQLDGGNDGLNTCYPLNNQQRVDYDLYRPTLGNPATVGGLSPWATEGFDTSSGILDIGTDSLGDSYALHPAMKAWHDLYQTDELAIIPGVHYPDPDYSHFRSEAIYNTGDPLGTGGLGWFGKYLDLAGFGPTEISGVIMNSELSRLFTPTGTSLFAFTGLDQLNFPASSLRDEKKAIFRELYAQSGLLNSAMFPELTSLGNTGVATIDAIEDYYLEGNGNSGMVEALLIDEEGRYRRNNSLVYDSPLNPEVTPALDGMRLARDLRHVAATIRADVGARFFQVRVGGFDTHSNQEQGFYHSYLLQEVAEAVGAFYQDMKQTVTMPGGYTGYRAGSLGDKVVIVTFSEFGRTSHQNAQSANAAGTDHATAGVQFAIGAPAVINSGIDGAHPAIEDPSVDDDDLAMTHDFRDFYGTLVERWLNVAPADIGPGAGKIFASSPDADEHGDDYTAYTPLNYLKS
ncbi:MAG: hypothetical protein ACI8TX_000802 [Hyphomicrobiaceae bacterium]|jgi:uncharacterized protein (DUF1501 family)